MYRYYDDETGQYVEKFSTLDEAMNSVRETLGDFVGDFDIADLTNATHTWMTKLVPGTDIQDGNGWYQQTVTDEEFWEIAPAHVLASACRDDNCPDHVKN